MKITEEQAKDLIWEEYGEDIEYIEVSDWINVGKGERIQAIFKHEGKCYELIVIRTGSDFTDWHYEYCLNCPQVIKKEMITHVWENAS